MNNQVTAGLACIAFPQSFWGFQQEQYAQRQGEFCTLAERAGAKSLCVEEAFFDHENAVQAARRLNDSADLAVLDVATFPEGKAALAFSDTLNIPLVLWARNEDRHGCNIAHNSFCGMNYLSATLRGQGRRHRCIFGSLNETQPRGKLRTALRLMQAARQCRGARIGLIGGGIVPRFHDIDISAEDRKALKERWDISFTDISLTVLTEAMEQVKNADLGSMTEDISRRFVEVRISPDELRQIARLTCAVTTLAEQESLAALAIRCWPEMQKSPGIWPCVTISVMNELGVPAACEGDPGGALDMLLASKLTTQPTTLLDIVDWDDEAGQVSLWHCGPTAMCWARDGQARLGYHNVDGADEQGQPKCGLPAVVDLAFTDGPATVLRTVGALDDEFICEGVFRHRSDRRIQGCWGELADLQQYGQLVKPESLRNEILMRGIPHHFAVFQNPLSRD